MPSIFDGSRAAPLSRYPGLGVIFQHNENPYFRLIVEENLRTICTKDIGITLLKEIASARPGYRHNFPTSINVIITPLKAYFVQAGYRLQIGHATPEDAFSGRPQVPLGMTPREIVTPDSKASKSGIKGGALPMTTSGLGIVHESMNQEAASNGAGTVCIVNFHNARVAVGDRPFIYLAHELIHCLHSLTGTKHRENDEPATIGLGQYASEPLTENRFLAAFGLPQRTHY